MSLLNAESSKENRNGHGSTSIANQGHAVLYHFVFPLKTVVELMTIASILLWVNLHTRDLKYFFQTVK